MKIFTRVPVNVPRASLTKGHRYRTPDGSIYPSVTTILNSTKPADAVDDLDRWRAMVGEDVANYIMHEAATIGTQAHRLNEDYLNGKESEPARLLARAHHENFRPHLDRMDRIYGTELPLFSRDMKIAGMADCIAEYDGILSVIDYKTKRTQQQPDWVTDYHLQATAYCMMFKEMTGIAIKQCVILVSSERDTIQEFLADPREHAAAFLLRLKEHERMERVRALA